MKQLEEKLQLPGPCDRCGSRQCPAHASELVPFRPITRLQYGQLVRGTEYVCEYQPSKASALPRTSLSACRPRNATLLPFFDVGHSRGTSLIETPQRPMAVRSITAAITWYEPDAETIGRWLFLKSQADRVVVASWLDQHRGPFLVWPVQHLRGSESRPQRGRLNSHWHFCESTTSRSGRLEFEMARPRGMMGCGRVVSDVHH
ncbi:uncharacterized protein P884DRAFT_65412 [Thermothelomyces heterothallicus CBS 202.75]|uniref:uncharacterized protein n=1 Tax=Thermothelomyces heterothallicus CBS 202.75 TaxID=1149848 RepID=UPI00374391E5